LDLVCSMTRKKYERQIANLVRIRTDLDEGRFNTQWDYSSDVTIAIDQLVKACGDTGLDMPSWHK
jgi:hypothetical protein